MISRIYTGELMHARLKPVKHEFRYPVYIYSFDVDRLAELEQRVPLFGYNRFRPVSIYDKDYLGNGGGTIRQKAEQILARKGIHDRIARIDLVTSARYFSYVFNPVSFFYCYLADGSVRAVIAEVNNTFKETHVYVLDGGNGRTKKEFYVSPFYDVEGEYEFKFSDLSEKLDIWVNYFKNGEPDLLAQIKGMPKEFNQANLMKTLVRFPLSAALTIPRIAWQAAKLRYRKKLPVVGKPAPLSPMTIKRNDKPDWFQKICMNIIFGILSRTECGKLTFTLPDGRERAFTGHLPGADGRMQIRSHNFFVRSVFAGDIGWGEGFQAGEWDTPELIEVFKFFVENTDALDKHHVTLAWASRVVNKLLHLVRRNTAFRSKRNIKKHYDLGNDFYQQVLDESMMYSCAVFRNSSDSLTQAQHNKIDMMIEKARIRASDYVLEIGSGWGGFAVRAAQKTGCRVKTVTLSEEQCKFVREKVRSLGLENKIEVEICDYRKITGIYDKIVSIEMLEAVGHEYYGTFFSCVDRLLAPEGLAVIQTISMPDQRYDDYLRRTDWIQKHIFPGGNVPSLEVLCKALSKHSRLIVEDLENIGIHYARTLREWREHFNANWENVKRLGFDERFRRTWNYYLAYCEAGFRTRHLGDLQLILTRANNRSLECEGTMNISCKQSN